MDGQILARFDELILVAIELQPPALGEPGPTVVGLLEADGLRVRAIEQQGRDAVLCLFLEVEEIVALGAGREVEDASYNFV